VQRSTCSGCGGGPLHLVGELVFGEGEEAEAEVEAKGGVVFVDLEVALGRWLKGGGLLLEEAQGGGAEAAALMRGEDGDVDATIAVGSAVDEVAAYRGAVAVEDDPVFSGRIVGGVGEAAAGVLHGGELGTELGGEHLERGVSFGKEMAQEGLVAGECRTKSATCAVVEG
jgi:hypothetical protein